MNANRSRLSSVVNTAVTTSVFLIAAASVAGEPDQRIRDLVGWGWQDRPHGATLASDVLGQFSGGNPALPSFGSYGPYGGPQAHGFFFFAFNAGRYQVVGGLAAHLGAGKLAVPDYWNHRVLLFDLRPDGSLASREASGLIGQERFDEMEIGQGPARFQYPAACAFDPQGQRLFVADEYNHRVLEFRVDNPRQAVRVYGQADFERWGIDGSSGELVWDSTRQDVRGGQLQRNAGPRGMFLPRGVASDGSRLFVSDCDNHRVLMFDARGSDDGPEAVAVLGQADFSSHLPNRGGPAAQGTLCFPGGLALDPGGRYLLVADSLNFRVLVFDISGRIENGMPAVAAVSLPGSKPRERADPALERNIAGAVAVAVDAHGKVFVSDRGGRQVLAYRLDDLLAGKTEPVAAIGRFEMNADLWQMKPGYGGPTGLAAAGNRLYVCEPRGNRVLCYNADSPERPAEDLLGQFYGNDLSRPNYHKYGPNNGPDPYGFDFADGEPALSVTADGAWLLAADPIGGRLLFFPLRSDGLPLDRAARLALGVPSLDARANSYGTARFNRPGHSVLTPGGGLFASDFQGSRILYFELANFAQATSAGPLESRSAARSARKDLRPREQFEAESIDSGVPAAHVLGQVDFYTGQRDTASQRQMGKEIGGLAYDRRRGWLFVAEKLNHRVLIVDVSRGVETFMPALAVLGQRDFDHNAPQQGNSSWTPGGMTLPAGVCYDHATQMLFVASGEGRQREILGFDLSGQVTNGMEPAVRIGGEHATVESGLAYADRLLAIDETNRRLWSGLNCLDISGDLRKKVPRIGWLGLSDHPQAEKERDNHSGKVPSLLGYSVGSCHRFGGAVSALAVNPKTGTVYVADTPRYRVLCFQPRFAARTSPINLRSGIAALELCGTGGLAPLRYSLVGGKLPGGLNLDADSGLITGTPRGEAGAYPIEVSVATALETTRVKLELQLENNEQAASAEK